MRITFLGALISIFFFLSKENLKAAQQPSFSQAQPVWAEGRETEMNLNLGFRGVFNSKELSGHILKITGSTLYRAFVNGKFLGYGPARASHGFYRIDEYDLSPYLKEGENVVSIEVSGYNVNTYYVLDQPSFLQAEITNGKEIVLATGRNKDFEAIELSDRLQKVERYSFQRGFIEYYRLQKDFDDWENHTKELQGVKLVTFPEGKFLPRHIKYPDFRVTHPERTIQEGTVAWQAPEKYIKHSSLTGIGKNRKGFYEKDLEIIPSLTMQDITNKSVRNVNDTKISKKLKENEFYTLDFGVNLSGFLGSKIKCTDSAKIYFLFDEILLDGDVKPKQRMPSITNTVVYELAPGTYNLESFEPYTFKYVKVVVAKGNCEVEDLYIREYSYPENEMAFFKSDDAALNTIYDASKQTLRQNTTDLFMDCPSRERGGWLCDSRFMAIMEKELTGKSDIAYNFYQNYALYTPLKQLPEKMVPMVYPADHLDGNFIPNWAMWFVIQVKDYADRGGDKQLIKELQPKVMGVLDYFTQFENKDGLLENLDGWKFVEWSKANQFVNGVNYPTNILYAKAIADAATLYGEPQLQEKATKLNEVIRKQSYNGTFFVDNAVRDKEGNLKLTGNISEVNQYYAFFFNLVTPKTHADLWQKLVNEFGPKRDDQKVYPNVAKANAFMGNYMRMELFAKYGLEQKALKEMSGYFLPMAELTGTLWEYMDTHASCNHGFASYLAHILNQAALGIHHIDYINKKVTVRFSENGLDTCEGAIPVGEERIYLKWKKTGKQLKYDLSLPDGYTVNIENPDHFEISK